MRSAILVLLFTVLQLNAQQAKFSGVVIDAVTKEPLSGAHNTLMSVAKFPDPSQPYGATSGSDVRFSILNHAAIPSGTGLLAR